MEPFATETLPKQRGVPDPLPPSSKIVLRVLGTNGAMTHKDLVRESHCNPRTVRYALKKLKEQGLLVAKMNRNDMRQIIYEFRISPAPDAGGTAGPGARDPEGHGPAGQTGSPGR